MSEWVSVDNRLPEPDICVACWANDIVNGWFEILYHSGDGWMNSDGSGNFPALVSHWMPLPEPPEL